MRGLSTTFRSALKSGLLKPVLRLVQRDSTLCLEIRKNYINIYYRGGNILKIAEKGDVFDASFDKKYLNEDETRVPKEIPSTLAIPNDVIGELAEYLKIGRTKLYRLAKNGEIPASKIGEQWRFDIEEIDRWMKTMQPKNRGRSQ